MQAIGGTNPLAALEGKRILVLEDEYFLATGIARSLQKMGAEVIGPFPTVRDGLTAVQGSRLPDLALLDINLRGELVYPLADLLRQKSIPFVFMTGYDRAALAPEYREVPVCDKPVDLDDLSRSFASIGVSS